MSKSRYNHSNWSSSKYKTRDQGFEQSNARLSEDKKTNIFNIFDYVNISDLSLNDNLYSSDDSISSDSPRVYNEISKDHDFYGIKEENPYDSRSRQGYNPSNKFNDSPFSRVKQLSFQKDGKNIKKRNNKSYEKECDFEPHSSGLDGRNLGSAKFIKELIYKKTENSCKICMVNYSSIIYSCCINSVCLECLIHWNYKTKKDKCPFCNQMLTKPIP